MKKTTVFGGLIASLAAGLLATGVAWADAKTVKVVSSLPRTGSANAQTTAVVNGIRMALDENGGKAGELKIVYEDWDDASPEKGQWDPSVEAANADRAIADTDVVAYIGTYNSGAAKISMPKLNRAPLVMVSPGNTWPGLTKAGFGEAGEPMIYRPSGKVTYFRVIATDDVQGPAGAKWAKEMGVSKVYILHDRELYGKGVAEMFRREAEKIGLSVLGFEGIEPKSSNYRALGMKIRQRQPDLVYFGGTTQTNAGQIAKDLRAAGYGGKLMLPDGCFETALIQSAGADSLNDRTFITFPGITPTQLTGKGKLFYETYKKRYNSEPEAYAVYGYEAMSAVIDGIRRAGVKDRQKIIDAVAGTKDFVGALGTWSFDPNGDITTKVLSGNRVVNGKFEFVKTLELQGPS
jgi:branched-chain amino acid transport system substrate-binding protein